MAKKIMRAKASLVTKRKARAGSSKAGAARLRGANGEGKGGSDALPPAPPKPDVSAKELKRLKAIITKLTSNGAGEKPKQLYFDEVRLAGRWGMSVKHIRTLRYGGVGPKVTYFGRSVRYRLRDIVTFEKSNTFTSRSDMEVRRRAGI